MSTKTLHLFNTETRKKESIIPIKKGMISLYTCGPTVYNYAHIGNFRTYVFEDILRRTLKYFGFKVKQAMNITDVEDKTIMGALQQNKTLKEFTEFYTKAFFEDLHALNIEKVEYYPRATDYIPQMIAIVQTLLEKGVAYYGKDGSVYYSIEKFPTYGRLSHLQLDKLKIGASERVVVDEYTKENIADFVLWKAYDPIRDGKIFWESPFGKGRPGWHIECSAMAMQILGESIDIHVGGVDNMFPHHENEIAQSEAFSGKPFVKYWLHAEHLLVNHKKMSKSLGNFYTLRDLIKLGYTGREVRFLLLSTHYRTQLNFTLESLAAARVTLQRFDDLLDRLKNVPKVQGEDIAPLIQTTRDSFQAAMADDLNISLALAAVFELIRKINQLCDDHLLGKNQVDRIQSFFKEIDAILGVVFFTEEEEIPVDLLNALRKREEARKTKHWTEADKQRDLILAQGYLIEDTPAGPRLKKAK